MLDVKPCPKPVAEFPRHALSIIFACALAACGGGQGNSASGGAGRSAVASLPTSADVEMGEDDREAPVDFGAGPVGASGAVTETLKQLSADGALAGALADINKPVLPAPAAYTAGVFGPAFAWPVMPIHMVLLPDGRVLGYGTDDLGVQGAALHYAVWDPGWDPAVPGADISPFQLLPNVTGTDIFCGTQLVLPSSGEVLLAGGDRPVNGKRNYAVADVNIFNPADNSIRRDAVPMNYRRWYGTAVTTATGEVVVMGGRDDRDFPGVGLIPPTVATYSSTPEIFTPGLGWRSLTTAQSDEAFGEVRGNWWYPESWLAPDGRIWTITNDGFIYALDPAGTGTLTKFDAKVQGTNWNTLSLMYAPGKILSVRDTTSVALVDIQSGLPAVTPGAPLSTARKWGFGTVLADGTVWLNGGSVDANTLADAVYTSELFDPATGQWTPTASATKARMYHSSSLLLPSGAVLTGGGGSPGPVRNLNAELYYPPYLFNPDGSEAARPVIGDVAPAAFTWSSAFTVALASPSTVERVMLVRTGSATHSFNNEQRALALPFTQVDGQTLSVTAPASATEMPPGYYMLFVLQRNALAPEGQVRLVPSVAKVVKLG
ncbi:galactose oxidase-like domain-containing protein [Azohydromonas australica]|uniref:galactose oxidase-like domain-containing protein n=1 Tax=Azohydromonas australica TaxID=364039 RepID=UPI00041C72EF|nr:galactose oxidase-like domain-containing protein [Azohydromonas australica]